MHTRQTGRQCVEHTGGLALAASNARKRRLSLVIIAAIADSRRMRGSSRRSPGAWMRPLCLLLLLPWGASAFFRPSASSRSGDLLLQQQQQRLWRSYSPGAAGGARAVKASSSESGTEGRKRRVKREQPVVVEEEVKDINVVLTHAICDFDSLASAVGLAKLWAHQVGGVGVGMGRADRACCRSS